MDKIELSFDDEEHDIVDRLTDWSEIIEKSRGVAIVTMLSGYIFEEAAEEIRILRNDIQELQNKIQRMALDHLTTLGELMESPSPESFELITAERNRWQATAAGLLEDISNADDEIERLREENARLASFIHPLGEKSRHV